MSILDEIKQSYKKGSVLNKLIYINVGVFLALHILLIFLTLGNVVERGAGVNSILYYLAIPADLLSLARRPWTVITYMFTHGELYHILFNLLILFWFGKFFILEFGLKKVLGIYLLGGLAGGALYVLFYNVFPAFSDVREVAVCTGASASIMAIVMAVAAYVPNRNMNIVLIGPVKILYVALFIFTMSTILDFTDNTGGKIAHIGGALVGFLFADSYKKGKSFMKGFDRFLDSISGLFKPGKKKMKVSYKRPADDFEYNKQKADEQKEIDHILDKISKGGYDSLSKSEKEKLFNMKK